MGRRKRTVLRAGFEEDFVVFHAEWKTMIESEQDTAEEVEWIECPDKPPRSFRVNTIVAFSFLSLFVSLIALIK